MLMIVITLLLLGLVLGSFVNALVWRLHQTDGKIKKNEKLSITRGRSMCVHCKHELAAKDLIPILSWLELRGKCRYCKKPISWQYPTVELLTSVLFAASYVFWPNGLTTLLGWTQLLLWLFATVIFVALIVYDLRWMILPNKLVYILIVIATIFALNQLWLLPAREVIIGVLGALVFSAGLFYLLFQISGGKWIGGGDVKLAVALGLLLGSAISAVQMLFLASLGGSIIAVPLLIAGKAGRKTQLPFGPFLIMATYIVVLFGADITGWYERAFLGL